MINISTNNFDMAFWLSSTNIRNLMRAAIDIDINIGQIEGTVDTIQTDLSTTLQRISDSMRELDLRVYVLEQTITGSGGGEGGPLEMRVSLLENQMEGWTQQIQNLTTRVTDLATIVQENIDTITTINDSLIQHIENQQNVNNAQQAYNTQVATEIIKLSTRIDALEAK